MTPEALELLAEMLRGTKRLPGAVCPDWTHVFAATALERDERLREDEDARVMREYAITTAQRLCRSCPALAACRSWVQSLPPPQRPPGVVAGQVHNHRPNPTNPEETAMTQPDAIPTPSDRARALRAVLAVLNSDADTLLLATREPSTPAELNRFVLALADGFAMLARRRLEDPIGYLENWIAFELQRADDDHDATDDDE